MVSKFHFIALLVLIFCCLTKVRSADDDKVTVYVTVTTDPNKSEEATSTIVEPVPTVSQSNAEAERLKQIEYEKFEKALFQTNDKCMEHAYAVSLNLFAASKIDEPDCENRYSGTLEELNKKKPCALNHDFYYGIKYMDAVVRLLCTSYTVDSNSTLEDKLDGAKKTELCPQIKLLKTDDLKYRTELFKGCEGKLSNDTCLVSIYKRYKEIKEIRSLLGDKDQVGLTNGNETVVINMNITNNIYDELEKCDTYVKTESNAISIVVSLASILVYSLFVIFINI